MPAFSFEKISPPVNRSGSGRVATAVVIKQPRGVIVTLLDRLAESRLEREARKLRRDFKTPK